MDRSTIMTLLSLGVVALIVVLLVLLWTAMTAFHTRTRTLRVVYVQLAEVSTALLAVRDEKRSMLRTLNKRSRELTSLRQTLSSAEEDLKQLRLEKESAITDAQEAHARADSLAVRLATALDKCDMLEDRLSQAQHAHLELLSKLHADASLRTAAVLSLTQPQVSVPNPAPIRESNEHSDATEQTLEIDMELGSSSGPTANVTESTPTPVTKSPPDTSSIDLSSNTPAVSIPTERDIPQRAKTAQDPDQGIVLSADDVQPEAAGPDTSPGDVVRGGLLSVHPDLSISSSSSSLASTDGMGTTGRTNGGSSHLQAFVETPQDSDAIRRDAVDQTADRQTESSDEHVLELHRAPWTETAQPDLQFEGRNGLCILSASEHSYERDDHFGVAHVGLYHRFSSSRCAESSTDSSRFS